MGKVIKVENLSKAYQLGDFGTGTISRDLERAWARMRGKEDPFLKIGEINDRSVKGKSDIVWSLKDLNFEIEQGDAVGIIGRNGAGKSTLLKILSRITSPTTGSIKIKGRVASLLEVGTGFHPELTGRENIFLNGAILGMRKAEILRKFDEIVDFSGVERYIDTPVKRYSSGMYVRLAFAVAAYLESEILIVDEVLAVGDAEFQKKCLGKMGDVSKGEGRTVLFVSHNMSAVETLCNKGILLANGKIDLYAASKLTINQYLASNETYTAVWINSDNKYNNTLFTPIKLMATDSFNRPKAVFDHDEAITINFEFNIEQKNPALVVGFALYHNDNLLFWALHTDKRQHEWVEFDVGNNCITAHIPPDLLNEGTYNLKMISALHYISWITDPDNSSIGISFDVKRGISQSPNWLSARPGLLAPVIDFKK
jgi:lipopolysaccharide transport system ATP-binding protein